MSNIMRMARKRRMMLLQEQLRLTPETTVLDVGGAIEIWRHAPVMPKLTITNLPNALVRNDPQFQYAGADGCALPFRDKSFDVVFSNSVIEHVGNIHRQRAFAQEAMRVGKRFWVQTPNRGFPLEQHLLVPFVHWLPNGWREPVLKRFTGWQLLTKPSDAERLSYIRHFVDDMRLLSASDLRELFPQARIIRERVGGITKSLIATA